MKKPFALILYALAFMQSCTHIDNYMLGKDNTPKPKPLLPIKNKVEISSRKTLPIANVSRKNMHSNIEPVIEGSLIFSASQNGTLQVLDKSTAKIKWARQAPNKIISGPAINNDIVVVGTNQASLIAYQKNTGNKLWTASLSSDALAKPVIKNQKVFAKTIDGRLYAFDAQTGREAWVNHHGAPNLILKASSSPVIVDDVAIVGYSDGKLDAVNINTGSMLWQRGIAYASGASDVERLVDIDSTPVVKNGIAYIATYQGFVGAFSLRTGQFIWRKPASTYKDIAIDEHTLYLADSQDVVWAYNLHNGKVRWKQDQLKARVLTEPVLLNNQLVVGDATGALHLLSTKTGEFLSRKQLRAPIYHAPTVYKNQLYVMTNDGRLNELSVG